MIRALLLQASTVPADTTLPYGIVAGVCSVMAAVIVTLFWELRKCGQARVEDAKAQTEKALLVQGEIHEAIDKLVNVMEALQRGARK